MFWPAGKALQAMTTHHCSLVTRAAAIPVMCAHADVFRLCNTHSDYSCWLLS